MIIDRHENSVEYGSQEQKRPTGKAIVNRVKNGSGGSSKGQASILAFLTVSLVITRTMYVDV